jgi:hypothetical protein
MPWVPREYVSTQRSVLCIQVSPHDIIFIMKKKCKHQKNMKCAARSTPEPLIKLNGYAKLRDKIVK